MGAYGAPIGLVPAEIDHLAHHFDRFRFWSIYWCLWIRSWTRLNRPFGTLPEKDGRLKLGSNASALRAALFEFFRARPSQSNADAILGEYQPKKHHSPIQCIESERLGCLECVLRFIRSFS